MNEMIMTMLSIKTSGLYLKQNLNGNVSPYTHIGVKKKKSNSDSRAASQAYPKITTKETITHVLRNDQE